jgi:glycosyltransferase involved in cell wall biosynthesis
MKKKLSIICPVHNEEDNLNELIRRIFHSLKGHIDLNEVEIILVDDNSSDKSLEVINYLSDKFNNITVAHHDKKMGQAGALSSGFCIAKGDIVITMDADLQVFPEDLPIFLNKISEDCDLVNGIRVNRKEALILRLSSFFFSFLVSMFFYVPIKDASSNFTAVKGKLVKGLSLVANDHRYIIPIMKRRGALRIAEINVRHSVRRRGKSKYRLFKMISAVPEFFSFYFRLMGGHYDLI